MTKNQIVLHDVDDVPERYQTAGEETANSISHGLGFVLALIGMPILILRAARTGDTRTIVGASIFAGAILLLYLTSTLYHALPRGKAKHVFRLIEHKAIFLLIAGTYTPFTLGVLRGPWGWTLFGIIWGLAATGVILKLMGGVNYPVLSNILYLGMGWTLVIAIKPLWTKMPHAGMMWILLGGLAYTLGVAFYTQDRRKYFHLIWHFFVLAGTACHYVAVLLYAA